MAKKTSPTTILTTLDAERVARLVEDAYRAGYRAGLCADRPVAGSGVRSPTQEMHHE